MANLLKTATAADAPLDGSGGAADKATVSNFLTVQSLTNFGAMAGAISVAWLALQNLAPWLSAVWVPFAFSAVWGAISVVMSWDGLKNRQTGKRDVGAVLGAIFIAVINCLVLASAVVGAAGAAGATP